MRDSDKSVIQFNYGDDGMEVTRAQFLKTKQMEFLADNCKAIIDKKTVKQLKKVEDYEKLEEHVQKVRQIESSKNSSTMSVFCSFSVGVKNTAIR